MIDFKIVLYEDKYADEINALEKYEWGNYCANDIRQATLNKYIAVVVNNNEVIGVAYGDINNSSFHLEVVIIKNEYKNKKIGSALIEYIIEFAKSKNLLKIQCEGVYSNGKLNIENLMKKYGFKEIKRAANYWGKDYPDSYCKVCNTKSCNCTAVLFTKELDYGN